MIAQQQRLLPILSLLDVEKKGRKAMAVTVARQQHRSSSAHLALLPFWRWLSPTGMTGPPVRNRQHLPMLHLA
jgi:hypothetical protein